MNHPFRTVIIVAAVGSALTALVSRFSQLTLVDAALGMAVTTVVGLRWRELRAVTDVAASRAARSAQLRLWEPRASLTLRIPGLFRIIITRTSIMGFFRGRLALLRFSNEPSRIIRPPLSRFASVVRAVWGEKTYARVFGPARADLIFEWQEAVKRGELKLAWWIKYGRSSWTMFWTVLHQIPFTLLDKLKALFKGNVA
jgi:hypothetical protein